MKKILLAIALLSPILTYAQKPIPKVYDVLIGTYTTGKSKGIYVYRFYAEKGKLEYLSQIDGVTNPSYLTASADNKFVYAVNELDKGGDVSAFKFDAASGKLEFINKQTSGGDAPCHINIDKERKNVIVANYTGGSLEVLPVEKDGSLGAPSQLIQDQGTGPNKDRQEKAHVHMSIFSPDEKYLMYTDLGTDKINIERYHAGAKQPLTPSTPAVENVTAGFGPRHMAFGLNKKFLYLLSEMGSAVNVYSYDNGKLKQLQSITMLPDGFNGQTGAAAVHISPDGRFLYASNRLETNDISVYAINQETGMLTFIQRQTTYGKNPRDFAIDPTGAFLICANQGSDSIYIFKINKETGKLSPPFGKTITEVGNPVCIKFVPAE